MRQAVQLIPPTAAAAADATLFTSSAAGVTIMRHVRVCNTDSADHTFSVAIGGTTATAANCIAGTQNVPAHTSVDLVGYYVLPAGTAVHGVASATSITFEASGDLSVAGG